MTGQEQDVGSLSALSPPPSSYETADDFRQLFDLSYQPLVAYARRRVESPSDADDLVAEVYAIAWRRRHEIDGAVTPLPWLYGIAGNVLRNQRRSTRRRLQLADRLQAEPEPPSGHDPAERSGADLRAALSQLTFDDQEVLRLVAWEGLSHGQVGQILGCTANAAGIRLHRARQRLADALDPPVDPEPAASTDHTVSTEHPASTDHAHQEEQP